MLAATKSLSSRCRLLTLKSTTTTRPILVRRTRHCSIATSPMKMQQLGHTRQNGLGSSTTPKLRNMATVSSNSAPETLVSSQPPRILWTYFKKAAVPMLGFGFMDNTIMIQAGNYIDCTIGVWLGLSTLAAAACGQIVSAGASVMFGNVLERAAQVVGILPGKASTNNQHVPQKGQAVQRTKMAGSLVGVILGATLGLVNLYWIDTKQSSLLKLEALTEKQEFAFSVQVSNDERRDATTVIVRGPDVDGVLASLTATLTSHGYSLVELHAHQRSNDHSVTSEKVMEDVFVIRPRLDGKQKQLQVSEGDLEAVGKIVLQACKDPLSAHSLKQQVHELETTNTKLRDRISVLEHAMEQHQIQTVSSNH